MSNISTWTIVAALNRFGPMSMEALAGYINSAKHVAADAEEIAIEVNGLIESGVVVLVEGSEPLRVMLAPYTASRQPFERFNHMTMRQADRIQRFRSQHPDCKVAQGKVAEQIGCTLEQLRAFIARNPRPEAA